MVYHVISSGYITSRAGRRPYGTKVPFRDLRYFMHKASVTSVNAKANAYSADWLMSVFVNEPAPPHVRSQHGHCMQQCRRIMKGTLIMIIIFVFIMCLHPLDNSIKNPHIPLVKYYGKLRVI